MKHPADLTGISGATVELDDDTSRLPRTADAHTNPRRLPFSVELSRLLVGDWRDVPDLPEDDVVRDGHLDLGWLERDALGRDLAGVGR